MIIYYLATNEVDVFHYGEMEEEWETTTGQPKLFFYNTEEELISALASYNQEYQNPNAPKDPLNTEPLLPEE